MKPILATGAILAAAVISCEASATSYVFAVTCQQARSVVEWKTGSIDPGKEYLRVATGVNHPNCSVTDYDPVADSNLPREILSHEGGVVAGIPVVGLLVCQYFKKC